MLEVGTLAGTRLEEIPQRFMTESVRGRVYHLHIETKGITDEREAAFILALELERRFKAKVVWIRVENGTIETQITGSPFAWGALIGALPEIFGLIGVILLLVSLWTVVSAVPPWAWATLAVGVVLLLLGPTIGKSLIPPPR